MEVKQDKIRVIIVTDGDKIAKKAVEKAAENIGGRCISCSAGNPSPLSSPELIKMIKSVPYDPVVVMVDDRGHSGMGKGEVLIYNLGRSHEIEILGVVAVASNTEGVNGIKPDFSINKNMRITSRTVDKRGNEVPGNRIYGDTVDILECMDIPVIVGIGDPGKMDGRDEWQDGAPVVTKALEEIIKRSTEKHCF